MWARIYAFGARQLFRVLLLPEPRLELTPAKQAAFEDFAARLLAGGGETIPWALPHPKHEFTRWLTTNHRVLLHGSPRELDALEPAQQTDFSGVPVTAVFATDDGIWPLFFATLDRSRAPERWSLRNAAMVTGEGKPRYYMFSADRATRDAAPFGPGFVHIVPRETFRPTSSSAVHFPEWVSHEPVKPLARIALEVGDFPFRERVGAHRMGEFFPLTWLLYRWRTR